jgi:hypothetical protein
MIKILLNLKMVIACLSNFPRVNQGFILCTVVGGLAVNLQDVLKLLPLRRDKQHACACSFEVEDDVEVHYLVFRPLLGSGHLDLCPLRHKVCEDLRLDRLPGAKLDVKFSKLDRPHYDAVIGFAVADDLS